MAGCARALEEEESLLEKRVGSCVMWKHSDLSK